MAFSWTPSCKEVHHPGHIWRGSVWLPPTRTLQDPVWPGATIKATLGELGILDFFQASLQFNSHDLESGSRSAADTPRPAL